MAAAVLFGVLYWQAGSTLPRDWWREADASHGLLLGPIALYLAWRAGIVEERRPQPVLGTIILGAAVCLRIAGGLAAEIFTLRISMLLAAIALIVFTFGLKQIRHWWLPISVLALALPIPAAVLSSIALPLQLRASEIGAALMEMRYVPVHANGNVIQVPGRTLFVTEACSGLRSLTALLSLSLLFGGLFLRSPWFRGSLILFAIPVAVLLNGVRIFLTGFFVYFVSPAFGDGFLHYTEGWLIFLLAVGILGVVGIGLSKLEQAMRRA